MAFNYQPHDIAKIDEEIDLLETRLRHLRSTRNTLVPISRLPADVLERIFNIARLQGTHTIHLSWVSQTWRITTLGLKQLWTLIDNSNLRWTSIYLERSFPTPLTIDLKEKLPKGELFSKIIGQLHRTRALMLPVNVSDHTHYHTIQSAFSQHGPTPHPYLNHLRLGSGPVSQDMFHSFKNAHGITFRRCTMSWKIPPPSLPYLQSLSLVELRPRSQPSLSQLLSYLESMPALKYLTLVETIDEDSDRDQSMARHLFTNGPTLTSLTMTILHSKSFQTTILFLQKAGCITRETDVSIKMYTFQDKTLDQVKSKLQAFGAWVSSMGKVVSHLGLRRGNRLENSHIITLECGNLGIGSIQDSGSFHLEILFISYLTDGLSHVSILPQCFDLQHLNVLWVKFAYPMNISSLVDTFGHLPQLEHLTISSGYDGLPTQDLLARMSVHHSQRPDNDTSHHVPFPALKSLLIPDHISSEALHSFLQFCNSAGMKLETLGLATDGDVEKLREFMAQEDTDGFADEVINVGGADYFTTQNERYQFLERMKNSQDY